MVIEWAGGQVVAMQYHCSCIYGIISLGLDKGEEVPALFYFTLEYDDERLVREEAATLMNKYGITGEIGVRPIGDGRWRLEVSAEKELREATLGKLRGRRV